MSVAVTRAAPRGPAGSRRLAVVVWIAVAVVSVNAALLGPGAPIAAFVLLAFAGVCLWMFFSRRYEWSLAVLLLYLALLDGFIRLKTGVPELTLLRDALLYSIVVGAIVRGVVLRKTLEPPPLVAWVVGFTALVLVQLANPDSRTLVHSLAALRPHLEWVPLFFLGFAVMRDARRLRVFFVLLLLCASVNGVVNFVQLNLSLEQFSAWGPGYEERIQGTGDVAGRFYKAGEDLSAGKEFLRPRAFGLGSDMGFGGILGMVALPGGLALIALAHGNRRRMLLYAAPTAGAVFAVATSSQRTAVVASAVAVCAFALVASSRRRGGQVLAGFVLTSLITVGIGLALLGGSSGAFNRYGSIVPTRIVSTTYDYRQGTLRLVPRYAVEFPFGAGIGTLGPAASFSAAGRPNYELNGESEATFLIVELGVAGLLLLLAFNLRLILGAWRRIRRLADEELRILLAAVLAPVVAMFASWIAGAPTPVSPTAPYFWFAAGILAHWLFRKTRPATLEPRPGSW